ncbi:unnamed protein product [Schistosoma margrebowiei]|uniref:Uncharacterized protein n=1 Tax=Schistosoma margrebowiei TaxID=48269 RepID=A0A3P7XBR4_9TREM|nr:unnamed protein product [Schistosoma margrebowiei]
MNQKFEVFDLIDTMTTFDFALKLKLDELFLRWLTDRATQKVLRENLMQVKAGQSLEAMLALPTGIVVGPMSASFYGCLYSPSYSESSCLNPDGSYNSVPSAFTWGGTITSPRPNTPPYFPQPPFSKLYSPRSPRRHASTPSGLSIQIVKVSYVCAWLDCCTHELFVNSLVYFNTIGCRYSWPFHGTTQNDYRSCGVSDEMTPP